MIKSLEESHAPENLENFSFEYFIHQNVFQFKFQRRMATRKLGTKKKKKHIPDVDPVGVLEVTKPSSSMAF